MDACAGVCIVLIADVVLRTMRGYFLDLAGSRVDVRLSAYIMERVLGLRLESRPISAGSFAANLRSFETVRDFITSATVTAFVDVPFALIFLVVIAWIGWPMVLPVIVGALLVAAYAFAVRHRMQELSGHLPRGGSAQFDIVEVWSASDRSRRLVPRAPCSASGRAVPPFFTRGRPVASAFRNHGPTSPFGCSRRSA